MLQTVSWSYANDFIIKQYSMQYSIFEYCTILAKQNIPKKYLNLDRHRLSSRWSPLRHSSISTVRSLSIKKYKRSKQWYNTEKMTVIFSQLDHRTPKNPSGGPTVHVPGCFGPQVIDGGSWSPIHSHGRPFQVLEVRCQQFISWSRYIWMLLEWRGMGHNNWGYLPFPLRETRKLPVWTFTDTHSFSEAIHGYRTGTYMTVGKSRSSPVNKYSKEVKK